LPGILRDPNLLATPPVKLTSAQPRPFLLHRWIKSIKMDSTGRKQASYAIVSFTNVIESSPLPWGTTSQKAGLIALTRALTLAEGKTFNIFTDSKYAYHIVHSLLSALWEERVFLTKKGTPITNGSLILKLLKAAYLPTKVAVIHCKGHQPETTETVQGSAFADREAKRASAQTCPTTLFITTPKINPIYTSEEQNRLINLGATPGSQGWFLLNGKHVLPNTQAEEVLRVIHKTLHIGAKPILHFLQSLFSHLSLPSLIKKDYPRMPWT
jgi:ribonuclease HI